MKKTLAPALALGFAGAALAAAAAPANADVYYKSCAEAIAAHAAPIHVGEPGYRLGLDRDHDGAACDKNLPKGYVKKTVSKPAQPAPAKPSTQAPVSTKPAPAVQAPMTPAKPAPSQSARGVGPKANTDFVSTGDSSASTLAAFGLLAGAAGAGAWRVRSVTKR